METVPLPNKDKILEENIDSTFDNNQSDQRISLPDTQADQNLNNVLRGVKTVDTEIIPPHRVKIKSEKNKFSDSQNGTPNMVQRNSDGFETSNSQNINVGGKFNFTTDISTFEDDSVNKDNDQSKISVNDLKTMQNCTFKKEQVITHDPVIRHSDLNYCFYRSLLVLFVFLLAVIILRLFVWHFFGSFVEKQIKIEVFENIGVFLFVAASICLMITIIGDIVEIVTGKWLFVRGLFWFTNFALLLMILRWMLNVELFGNYDVNNMFQEYSVLTMSFIVTAKYLLLVISVYVKSLYGIQWEQILRKTNKSHKFGPILEV